MTNTMHIYSEHINVLEYKDWLTPAEPDWYKDLAKRRRDHIPRVKNWTPDVVNACPSFIKLFKNSYMLRMPCDLTFRVSWNPDPQKCHLESLAMSNFISVSQHDLADQMHPGFHELGTSLKINFKMITTFDKPVHMMYLHPQYELGETYPGIVMHGVIPFAPGLSQEVNCNTIIPPHLRDQDIRVKWKTPLAMLYFPEGKPRIKVHKLNSTDEVMLLNHPRHQVSFDYISKINSYRPERFAFLKKIFRL